MGGEGTDAKEIEVTAEMLDYEFIESATVDELRAVLRSLQIGAPASLPNRLCRGNW